MAKTEDVAAALTKKGKKRGDVIPAKDLLKTGSTLLDLAISGRRQGGFSKGRYFWMVGDSSSGKTFLMLTCLAEAAINPEFKDHDLIYDNVEDGALMDFERYFGPRMAARVQAPDADNGRPVYSSTIEEFYYNLDDRVNKVEAGGKPFIYLLDSMDALGSKYGDAKFQEAKKAQRKGKEAKGEYGDGKAKINSVQIRRMVNRLQGTGCILIILSQTRDNVSGGPFDPQQVSAGGRALKFYATVEIWGSVGSKIKKKIQGRDVVVGVHCRLNTKKNRITGKERTIEIPIYYDSGIDDIGAMVDFLTYWKFWPKNKQGSIDAKDWSLNKRREDLIEWIETNDMREDLEDITEEAWGKLEDQIKVERKSKYDV